MTTSLFPGQGRTCAAFIALLALAAAAAPAATITVNSTADAGGTCPGAGCTLRQAIAAAASNDTINFAAGLTTITLTSDELLINKNLTISGPGANLLTVQRSTVVTQAFRIFEIAYGNINVTISGLTITNGNANSGPSGYFSITTGGGIYNAGTATITNSTVSGNSALYGGGIASFGFGTVTVTNSTISGNSAVIAGGIDNSPNSTVTITNSSISGNTAADGGGIFNFGGTITVTNSTIAGNSASKVSGNNVVPRGGGIYNSTDSTNPGTVNLTNSTISGNTVIGTSGTLGGGIYNTSTVNARNTIIANNTATQGATSPDFSGPLTSQGYNLIGDNSGANISTMTSDQIGTSASPIDPMLDPLQDNGGPTFTMALLTGSRAINTGDPNAPPRDQRGYVRQNAPDIGAFEFGGTIPVTLANISTRAFVQTGDNVLIGGFIVTGSGQKRAILRAIGPSLNLPGELADPTLELHDASGKTIASNDNWMDAPNKQEIIDSTIAPTNNLQSAILMSLTPGAYTAIVRGVNNGTGIGVVEAYDLDRTAGSKLANISTRSFVQTGDNVLIGGYIVLGPNSQKVIIRAIGPSLNVAGKLADPTLELHDGNGALLEANDNWMDSPNKQAIIDSTIPPPNPAESAIVRILTPANYTAIVRGAGNSTGIAVVEVYALQ